MNQETHTSTSSHLWNSSIEKWLIVKERSASSVADHYNSRDPPAVSVTQSAAADASTHHFLLIVRFLEPCRDSQVVESGNEYGVGLMILPIRGPS